MSAIAGYGAQLYVTTTDTNPSASDLVASIRQFSQNESYAELDTSRIGEAFTQLIGGQIGTEVPISGDWDTADTPLGRFRTALRARTTIYVHIRYSASGSCDKIPVKVTAFNIDASNSSAVTYSGTIKSVGAVGSSTVS